MMTISKTTRIRLAGGIAGLLGLFMILGLFFEPIPILGGKITVWKYSEISYPFSTYNIIPSIIAIEIVKPKRTSVVTEIPINNPSKYNLELKSIRTTAAFSYSAWLLPYTIVSAAIFILGLIVVFYCWTEKQD